MTDIFTKFSELDPVLMEHQIEVKHGSSIFDRWSLLDEQRMLRQAAAALGGTLTKFALLDLRRALVELGTLANVVTVPRTHPTYFILGF